VFGQPSEEMLAALRQQAGEGVEIAVHTEHLGGFTRVYGGEPQSAGGIDSAGAGSSRASSSRASAADLTMPF